MVNLQKQQKHKKPTNFSRTTMLYNLHTCVKQTYKVEKARHFASSQQFNSM